MSRERSNVEETNTQAEQSSNGLTAVSDKAREALSLAAQEAHRQANGDTFNPYNPLAIQKAARASVVEFQQSLDDNNPLKQLVTAGKNWLDLDVQVTQSAAKQMAAPIEMLATDVGRHGFGIKDLPHVSIFDEPVKADPFTPMWTAEIAGEALGDAITFGIGTRKI